MGSKKKRLKKKKTSEGKPPLTPGKKRLYFSITLLIPVLLLILLEVFLHIISYGEDTTLFVSIPDETSKYYGINTDISKKYFTNISNAPTPRKDLFLKEKPENSYRIFVLGGSTAAGFPYGNNITFPRILNHRLSDVFPDKKIEIVNTAMTAINTYTQLDFMDEILEQKPDAILIYSGHNEYYGALGVGSLESIGGNRWIIKTTLFLQNYKTYLLVRDFVNWLKDFLGVNSFDEIDPSSTMMERIVKNKVIPFGSEDYESGKEQFESNLSEIISKAKTNGVQVVISELVSNVGDQEPFESVQSKDHPSAEEIYKTALGYLKGNKYDEAKKNFYLAKDLDALRFRAPEEFNEIIHKVADEYKIPVVPMRHYFEEKSDNGIIGYNLMHEHLHPNYEGYFLMADAFFNTIRKEKLINENWPDSDKGSEYYKSNWGATKLDSVYAYLSIAQLKGGWPFKKNGDVNLFLKNFKPNSIVDSVALKLFSAGRLTLEQGHIELARYYESKNELEKSFREFNALIYTVPYLDLFYEPAVKILIRMGDYEKALNILHESLNYQETAFAYQWIGQIYLINKSIKKGINSLEKAVNLGANDPALLFNLGKAYFETGQLNRGNDILNQLKKTTRNANYIYGLEELKKTFYQKNNLEDTEN